MRRTDIKQQSGFTIIEILVTVLIIGIISSVLFGVVSGTIGPSRKAEARMEMDRTARFIIQRIRRDLHGATLLPLSGRGVFVGRPGQMDGNSMDEMHFTSFSRLYISNRPDQSVVELGWYFKGIGGDQTLTRREADDIDENVDVGGQSFGITKDVKELKLRYLPKLGTSNWLDNWDSAQKKNQLPVAVSVELKLEHEGNERFYSTMVRLDS